MNKKINIFIVSAIIIFILAVGAVGILRKAAYNVDLPLTPEQRQEYEKKEKEFDAKIKAVEAPEKPDIDLFIEKARNQEYLGHYGDAIDTLLDSFRYYENTSAGWNNIAKLYDKVGEYKKAIVYYKMLIFTFSGNERYYYDLAWDYYRIGDIKNAQESYGRYAQSAHGKDEQLFNLLYKKQQP